MTRYALYCLSMISENSGMDARENRGDVPDDCLLYTVVQVADMFHCSASTIHRRIESKRLNAKYDADNKRYVISMADIRRYVDSMDELPKENP